MERHITQRLKEWQHSENRKPLILKGVRQCGKSYSLEKFGRSQFRRCFSINLEQMKALHRIFEVNLDPKQIISDLSFSLQAEIDIKTDLLILDEIQSCPKALTSLKYFSEQMPELALCAAGSLLGVELVATSFPVGKVDYLHLYPMSFSEFLMALNDNRSLAILNTLSSDTQLSEVIHEHLWLRFKWYLICGGLPEIVQTFLDEQDNHFRAFGKVRIKQQALINDYYADIAKHAGKQNAMHIERIFHSVPAQLSRTQNSQAARFQFNNIVPGIDRYQRLAGAIDWLNKAGLIIPTPIVNHIEIPLNAFVKNNLFKLYCFDVGILGAMNQLSAKNILDFDFGTYKGYFAENFIAQHLKLDETSAIYCWQKERSEIEFVKHYQNGILPIEVKAGHIVRAKSMQKYCDLYQPEKALILNGNPFNTNKLVKPYSAPIYLVEWINSII